MRNKDTYKNKVQNMFTAYLLRSVEGEKMKYLARRSRVEVFENFLEDEASAEPAVYFEELYESHRKDFLLEKEAQGEYPAWEDLADDHLTVAIGLLKPEERRLLFQHIFEEKPFEEIAREAGTGKEKIRSRYYYAVKKIRNWVEEMEETKR